MTSWGGALVALIAVGPGSERVLDEFVSGVDRLGHLHDTRRLTGRPLSRTDFRDACARMPECGGDCRGQPFDVAPPCLPSRFQKQLLFALAAKQPDAATREAAYTIAYVQAHAAELRRRASPGQRLRLDCAFHRLGLAGDVAACEGVRRSELVSAIDAISLAAPAVVDDLATGTCIETEGCAGVCGPALEASLRGAMDAGTCPELSGLVTPALARRWGRERLAELARATFPRLAGEEKQKMECALSKLSWAGGLALECRSPR